MLGKREFETLPPPGHKLESLLQVIPVHSDQVTREREDERGIRLSWEGPHKRLSFDLDPMGSELYRRMDGSTRLGELVENYAEEHRLRFFESAAIWVAYTRMLTQRQLLELKED